MSDLDSFLDSGFRAVSPADVGSLATHARDRCYSSGDVRFCVAADCLEIIASCWGDDGAVRQCVVEDLERVVMKELALAMRDEDPEAGRSLALSARASLLAVISSAGDMIYGR